MDDKYRVDITQHGVFGEVYAIHKFFFTDTNNANVQFWDKVMSYGRKVKGTRQTTLVLYDPKGTVLQTVEVKG